MIESSSLSSALVAEGSRRCIDSFAVTNEVLALSSILFSCRSMRGFCLANSLGENDFISSFSCSAFCRRSPWVESNCFSSSAICPFRLWMCFSVAEILSDKLTTLAWKELSFLWASWSPAFPGAVASKSTYEPRKVWPKAERKMLICSSSLQIIDCRR